MADKSETGQSAKPVATPAAPAARAQIRFARLGARKARLVADLARGATAHEARNILTLSHKRAAKTILKALDSAIANASERDFDDPELLRVSHISVDQGPYHKRHMPRAQGRSSMIRRPTSHITIELTEDRRAVEEAGKKVEKRRSRASGAKGKARKDGRAAKKVDSSVGESDS